MIVRLRLVSAAPPRPFRSATRTPNGVRNTPPWRSRMAAQMDAVVKSAAASGSSSADFQASMASSCRASRSREAGQSPSSPASAFHVTSGFRPAPRPACASPRAPRLKARTNRRPTPGERTGEVPRGAIGAVERHSDDVCPSWKRKYRRRPGSAKPTNGSLWPEYELILLPPMSQRCTTSNCSPILAL